MGHYIVDLGGSDVKLCVNRNPAIVGYSRPFLIEGSCNVIYNLKKSVSEKVQYSYEKFCFFSFIWISYFSTGLEFSKIPAAVSKGSFADIYIF